MTFELGKRIESFDQKEGSGIQSSNDSEIAKMDYEKKNENFDGLLQMLDTDMDLRNSLAAEVFDETTVLHVSTVDDDVPKVGNKKHKKENSLIGSGKSVYSREEMEMLRYVKLKTQKKFWEEIYNGFSATLKKEYDNLGSFKNHKHGGSNSDYHQFNGKRNYNNGRNLGESYSGKLNSDADLVSSSNDCRDGNSGGENGDDLVEDWDEDEETDDEYENIQRAAFKVVGEPNFESGPPEDGLEYLRRVRWEAKQIPKVKVVKLNNIKLKDQSVYMPKIPDIQECPPYLVPLRQWEDEFIADFSDLRLAFSQLENASNDVNVDSESIIFSRQERKSHASDRSASLKLTSGPPTLSTILAMDPASRMAMLRKRISLFESSKDLLKEDCVWLFALCAVVETPLDANTSASLRCLLRRCAHLRASKTEVDDDVMMLNVLATISGRFFGQSEV